MVKRTFGGQFGAVFSRFQTVWPILAQFLPGLETVMESNMGPKPVKNDFFQKWPQTLWEGQTDLSGPFWARFDQLYGYTGDRIPNTGYRTPVHRIPPYFGTRDGQNPTWAPKPVKNDLFQKWPRTRWECETDLKQIQ